MDNILYVLLPPPLLPCIIVNDIIMMMMIFVLFNGFVCHVKLWKTLPKGKLSRYVGLVARDFLAVGVFDSQEKKNTRLLSENLGIESASLAHFSIFLFKFVEGLSCINI